MTIRRTCAAGTFYPADSARLREEVERCFGEALSELSEGGRSLSYPFGLVVPHAGYRYSGEVAALGYREVYEQGRPEVVVLIGANHTGLGAPLSVAPEEAWDTPLGPLPVDGELADRLVLAWGAERDGLPFAQEHSVEVQLPFLRYLFGEVPIVPVVAQFMPAEPARRAGETLAKAVEGRGALLVASSDFTHHEPQSTAEARDRLALGHILNLDLDGFLSAVARERITICGPGAIAVLIGAARRLGLFGAQRLAYRTSGDVVGIWEQVVGYAAVALRQVDDVA
ncbi:MAG: AmmeMemoRadiSam system protein B [Candidatus Bipolaricaulota bacterium]